MIELELFEKTVEAEIRRKHTEYLRKCKCLPEGLNVVGKGAKANFECSKNTGVFGFIKCLFRVNKAEKVKHYNQAVDMALSVLKREYSRINKRINKAIEEESRGR